MCSPRAASGQALDLAREGDGIEGLEIRGEGGVLGGRGGARGEEALAGGLRRIVVFADRAEEFVLQPEQVVEAREDGPRGAGTVAIVAYEAADEKAVALLDPGLIVLAPGAAAADGGAAGSATGPAWQRWPRAGPGAPRGDPGAAVPLEGRDEGRQDRAHHLGVLASSSLRHRAPFRWRW
jgi:hypothetical protein